MKDDFVRKKVESLTLGEKMKKLRSQYRMSLFEISKATKIQVKYLEYLENGDYGKLPAEVYVRGFLKSYARHLGLEEEAFLKLYSKEKNIQANLGKEFTLETRPRLPLTSSFVLTSRTVVIGTIVLLVGGTFLYLFREFRSFVVEPTLVILEPANGATVESSILTVKGQTDRGARISVNGQTVFVGTEGDFSENLVLQPGLNQITVSAENRFAKVKSETVTIEANFAAPSQDTLGDARDKFMLTVLSKGQGVTVSIEADDEIVYSGELAEGGERAVTAEREVRLSTTEAARTWVSFRGGEAVLLSDKPGALRDVVFTTKGRQ